MGKAPNAVYIPFNGNGGGMFRLFGYRVLRDRQIDKQFFDKFKTFEPFFRERTPLIFDVGANNGDSVAEYKAFWPDSTIHSFEPQPDIFRQLQVEADKHRNVTCNNLALGAAPGEMPFFRNNLHSQTSSFHSPNRSSKAIAEGVHPKARFDAFDLTEERVKVDTLDNYVVANGIAHIDILKLDTQSSEALVLQGAQKTLAASKVSFLLTEIMFDDAYTHRPSFWEIESLIRDHGFLLYDISHIYKDVVRGRTHWVDAIYADSRRIKL